jgi:RecA-family ATPase
MSAKEEIQRRPKKWIITKDLKRCPDFHCRGHYDDDVKVKVKAVIYGEGVVDTKCDACGITHTSQSKTYHQQRPCTTCCIYRNVVVRIFDNQELAERQCSACKAETAALKHLRDAEKLQRQARVLREKQKRRKHLEKA